VAGGGLQSRLVQVDDTDAIRLHGVRLAYCPSTRNEWQPGWCVAIFTVLVVAC
jgi:hypothetical protein